MLFSSYVFLLGFLPVVFVVFRLLDRRPRPGPPLAWLVLASLFFYAWWNPPYLLLFVLSLVFNFAIGRALVRLRRRGARRSGQLTLITGITVNLAVLGYYKYWNFLLANVGFLLGNDLPAASIFLPLGISFFTFQQIAYLVDAHRWLDEEYALVPYCLFVSFFPHLIAGPLVHHRDVLPQFQERRRLPLESPLIAAGLTLLVIGLAKKAIVADSLAPAADALFHAATQGVPGLSESWTGLLAYSLQIYFDFSGYSDMAVGLGWLFGITLPLNFASPYRATSIIEFWRRWHMTLSRFLRDYLYIPLGGGRRGPVRRSVNLMATMLLGGLWHGASWTFVIWGGLHGLFLGVNRLWRAVRPRIEWWPRAPAPVSQLLTFGAVTLAWVFFRAPSLEVAGRVLSGLAGSRGLGALPPALDLASLGGILLTALLAPNSLQWITGRGFVTHPQMPSAAPRLFDWAPTRAWAWASAGLGVVGLLSLVRDLARESPFLYFQF